VRCRNSRTGGVFRLPINGSQPYRHNPGGGFGRGISPLLVGDLLSQTGLKFTLKGEPTVKGVSNPGTTINYELPKSANVRLGVYDMLGREVSALVKRRNARESSKSSLLSGERRKPVMIGTRRSAAALVTGRPKSMKV
jgi:hypothetical protein